MIKAQHLPTDVDVIVNDAWEACRSFAPEDRPLEVIQYLANEVSALRTFKNATTNPERQ